MMAKWTPEIEQRYTELRLRQLSGSLTSAEVKELSEIRAMVAVVEAEIAEPALQKLEIQQAALQDRLAHLQAENSELVQLLNQQALLIADTKRWLREFEQRYTAIQNNLTRLTKQFVAT
jgi:chromosome segregation ATPase